MGVGLVNRTSNIDSQLSELFANSNAWILELAKGVQIIEVGHVYTSAYIMYLHMCNTMTCTHSLHTYTSVHMCMVPKH